MLETESQMKGWIGTDRYIDEILEGFLIEQERRNVVISESE